VAYIEERKTGFLVIYRDADTGRKKSRLFAWGGDPNTAGGVITKEEARADAEGWKTVVAQYERRAKGAYEAVQRVLTNDPTYKPRPEFAEYEFATYLRGVIERDAELRDSTREVYEIGVRNHFEKDGAWFGESDIRAIDRGMIERFWADGHAIRNVRVLLSKAFADALDRELIDLNPMPKLSLPKSEREEVEPLTEVELERLADSAVNERDRLMILVMGVGGLRAGEVGGLRERDIVRKGDRCQLQIRQQAIRMHKVKTVTPLKTKSSRRNVPIPCDIADDLEAFLRVEPPAADGRVFHSANDGLMTHQTITNAVQRAAKRAKMRPVHAHQLRHTAVSHLIDEGANIKAIQAFVGHARIEETLGTYGHLMDFGRDALAASMEKRRERVRNGAK
jgi:integrase